MKTIGIAVRIEYLDHAWKYFTNETYIKVCEQYQFQPILLCSNQDTKYLTTLCDALLLPGGYDIASHYFQQIQNTKATLYAKAMDHFDFTLLDAFVKAQKPILGICRGMQLINVFFGGTLHQDIDLSTHEEDAHLHHLLPCPSTIFANLITSHTIVNSYHHQSVATLGESLLTGAYSSDHQIEAIIHTSLPILGVQWHPEILDYDQILPYFFDVLTNT